jgi:hypothetical protein
MPTKAPVECPKGYSTQHKKLGGKSMKTKNIRSATPRGFAKAVCWANAQKLATPRGFATVVCWANAQKPDDVAA